MFAYWSLITFSLLIISVGLALYTYFLLPMITKHKSRLIPNTSTPSVWNWWWKGDEVSLKDELHLATIRLALFTEISKPSPEEKEIDKLILLAKIAPSIPNPTTEPTLAGGRPILNSLSIIYALISFFLLLLLPLTPNVVVAVGVTILAGALPNQIYIMFWGLVEITHKRTNRTHLTYGLSALIWGALWGSIVGGIITFIIGGSSAWIIACIIIIGTYFLFATLQTKSHLEKLWLRYSMDFIIESYDKRKLSKEKAQNDNNSK